MAHGEGNTWYAKCHTHKLHVSRLLRRRTYGGVIHPPSIKVFKKKINRKREKSQRKRGRGGLCMEERLLGQFVGGRKERKVRKKIRKKI